MRQACIEAYGVSPDVRVSAGGGGGGGGGGIGSSSNIFSAVGGSSSNGSSSALSDEDFDDGGDNSDPSMPYIPAHLDYCLYELLKNAARATVESARAKSRKRIEGKAGQQRTLALSARGVTMPSFSSFFGPLPPIVVRICDAPGKAATLRISDQGGGIPEEQQEAVWRYGFTTAAAAAEGEETSGVVSSASSASSAPSAPPSSSSSSSTTTTTMMMDAMMAEGGGCSSPALPSPPSSRWRLGGLGFGLPLSRLYARYFGGDLRLISMPGYGVDAFLTLEHLAGDWVEPADEHVPVRPSATPKGKEGGSGGGGGGGGGGKRVGEGGLGAAAAAAAAAASVGTPSSPAASSPPNRGRWRVYAVSEQRRGSAEAMPGAALP